MLKKDFGCKHVLNSSKKDFFEDLTKLAKELKATAMIECVGGKFLG